MMKKVNSNLSKSHTNNIIKISYSEEENQKSIKCNGFNLIELPLNEDNISLKGINNESNIVVEIKEPEKESLLNKEYQRLKDVSHKVQDYYLSIENDSIVKENCHKCLMTDFECNELLHFNSRKELLNYLKYCFVFEKKILFTNHQIYINNKYDLEKCDSSYLNGWRFFIPKTICKSCFMKIINMDKLFANLKTVICDVSPKRNKINNSSNSNHKNINNNIYNNNEGKGIINNKKNGNATNVGGIKRIHAKKKYIRSKRIHGSQRINNINNNNSNNKMNNIKNNYKNNNKNLMKNHHFNKKNNNKNINNNNNKINENILLIDDNNNIIIDKKIFNDSLFKSIENYKNNNSNKDNKIKNIENIENNNINNKYNSQILFSQNQLRSNNNNNNQNNYQSNNSIGNTTINNINIVNKFNNKIDAFSNNNNNNNIISITNNNNINSYNQNDLLKFNNKQSNLIPKIFSNKYYVFIYVKITEILNIIKELKDNLKKYNSLFSNNGYLFQNSKIQFYKNFYNLIFVIYKKQTELNNFFNNFLDNISKLKSKIYSMYTQPMFQNYYQKICSMFEHLNKLENENKENFENYQNLFNNFCNISNQLLLIIKQ